MPEISSQNNTTFFNAQKNNNAGFFAYDLQEEKRRIALGTEEIKNELLEKWKKRYATADIFPAPIAAMHPDVVDFLLSFNLVSVYDDIARQTNLDARGRNVLPRIVWEIAKNKNWNGLNQALISQLPLAQSAHATIAQLLEQYVISKIRALSEKPFAKKTISETEIRKEVQLPLSKALQQYPKLGEQNITVNPLKLRYFQNSVRPSIKNWITDFHDNMSAGKHGAIDRGNYLFHSENGKKLTPIERQKLSVILKSLDEQTSLSIDVDSQSVVFQNSEQITKENVPPRNKNFGATTGTEDNYFQIPKSRPPLGSDNYSNSFQDNENPHFFPEQKAEDISRDNFKDFPVAGGKLSFSSPQTFAVERDTNNVNEKNFSIGQQKISAQPSSQTDKISPSLEQPVRQSQWTIKPPVYSREETSIEKQPSQPKINKNIVDLRN